MAPRLADPPRLPPPEELASGDFEMVVRRLADDLAFGTDPSRFFGSGFEFAQSRPYVPGDPVRSLDWRITARLGRPFVKEYDTLKRTAAYLVVDTSASMAVGSTALSKHDLALWIAAAVGLVAQRRMSPVAVIGAGERQTRVEPSLLRSDLWRTLEPLRARRLIEETRLAERIRDLGIHAKRSSIVAVISDLHDPDAIPALRTVAERHDVVAIHLIDPAERGELRAGFFRGREAETGRSFLAHGRVRWPSEGAIATDLARSGVSYLRLQTDLPILPPLRRFLAFRPAIGGGRG
ncbi:MAG TPA: DUF58 domain-containing protein [Phycisphaerales bacterium]|nr:DUF58 domain-containing protein [Phycisphaerales bacterium]HMP36346.1 DUF58 domain-containing protein [Phycisphaerales bacterium]